jgi:cation diffusion facilitator CzcD-associated flavoprotein CzcO
VRAPRPQDWTRDIDCANKRVVVFGSGATAVTLVPALAKEAAHVTMLQRSPSYIPARPDEDRIAKGRSKLGALAFEDHPFGSLRIALAQTKKVGATQGILPSRDAAREPGRQPASQSVDVGAHFTPRYNPWDQRLCLAPNGDFFQSIRQGLAQRRDGRHQGLHRGRPRARSGRVLEADLVVTATGLNLQVLGGAEIDIDGRPADPATTKLQGSALQRYSEPCIGFWLHQRLMDAQGRPHQ